jgi:hypothetical protein
MAADPTDHQGAQPGALEHLLASPAGLGLIAGVVLLGVLYGTGHRALTEKGAVLRPGLNGVVDAIGAGIAHAIGAGLRGLWRAVGAPVVRWLSGKPRKRVPTSTATWWRSGYSDAELLVAVAGDMAAPHAQAEAALASDAAWGAEPLDWKPLADRIGRWADAAGQRLWAPRGGVPAWAQAAGRLVGMAGRLSLAAGQRTVYVLAGAGAAYSARHRWPWAARAALRWTLVAAVVAVALRGAQAGTQAAQVATWAALVTAGGTLAAVAAVVTGPRALGWWAPRPMTDREKYHQGLWEGIAPLLGLLAHGDELRPADDPAKTIDFPASLSADGAQLSVVLPMAWQGTDAQRAALEHVIDTRLPGQWQARYQLHGAKHWATFTPKPKPVKPEPLPEYVRWKPTGDPLRTYYGETADGPAYVLTGSATPHVGIAGETGTGKSTVAYIPLVEARLAGWLVTVIDPKQNSLVEAQGKSGVRYATETYDCVMALAEFFVSMMAAEKYNSRAMRGKKHEHQPIPRLLIIDELPSFKDYIAAWWKYIKKERGFPPVLVWFALILMQGRSSDHRVFLGTHQFALDVFGSTMARDQVGTKMVTGETSGPSWAVAYGQTTPRLNYDSSIIGRGAISTKRRKPMKTLPDGTKEVVEEIQFAHIPADEINAYLDSAPQAPAWFDRGELAPWITEEDIARADSAGAVAGFLPGGEYVTDLTPDADAADSRQGAPVPAQRQGQSVSLTKDDPQEGSAGTPADMDTLAALVADEEPEPVRYSLTQACTLGIIDSKPGAARQKKSDWLKRGKPFPEGIVIKGVSYYTVEELHSVYGVPQGWNTDMVEAA